MIVLSPLPGLPRRGRLLASALATTLGIAVPLIGEATAQEAMPAGKPLPDAQAAKKRGAEAQPETVTVLGERRSTLVAKSSSAATKTDTPLIDTPDSVSVVTRAQMDQMNARTLVEALRYTAGVSTDAQNGFSTRYDLLSIRGFESNNDQYIDGLKLFNGAYWANQQIDSALLDRYDVLKGPPSVLYGQSDPGGAVVLTSKLPTQQPLHEVSIEGGSYGYVRGTVDLGGPLDRSGHWLYRLAATGTDSGTQDDHTRIQRYAVAPAVSWVPNSDTTLTVNGFYQHDPRAGNYDSAPIEGTILPNPNGPLPYAGYTGDDDFEKYDRTQAAIAFQLSQRLNDNWSVRSVGRYSNVGLDYKQVYATGFTDDSDNEVSRAALASEEHYDTITLEQQLLGHFNTGAIRHSLLVGVNWQNMRDHVNYYGGDATSLDLYGANVAAPVGDLTEYTDVGTTTNQEAVFAEDQMQWGRWHLQIGGREDWSAIDTRDALDSTSSFDQHDHAFTWRGGILYAFPIGISPYFNYSRSFQPTNSLSEAGTPFKPTTGEQYEAGIKYQPTGFDGFLTAALFHIQERNVLVSDPNNYLFSVQTGGLRSEGVELEAHANLTRRLNLVASYTYQNATYDKNSGSLDGQRQTDIPAQFFSVWGHYDIHDGRLNGLGFGAGVRYEGNTITDNTVEYITPNYTLVDAQIQYRLGNLFPRLRDTNLQVTAQNLLDKKYITSCYSNTFGCSWGTRRTVIAKLSYRW